MAVTLAAVEDSNPSTYIRIGDEDSTDSFNLGDPEDLSKPTTKPITASLRSTLKHLRARGGFRSYFRELRSYIDFAGISFATLVFFIGRIPLPGPVFIKSYAWILTNSMLFATWEMAWIHRIIARKSRKTSYWRMLGFRQWPKIAPAAALYYVPFIVTSPLHAIPAARSKTTYGEPVYEMFKLLCSILVTSALTSALRGLLCLPARAIFVRVVASLLPEDAELIVQFDSSFGGKVQPESTGGSGKLSIKDAWTTWEWSARIRCVKMALKALALQLLLYSMGIMLITGLVALDQYIYSLDVVRRV